LPDEKLKTEHF